MCWRHHVSKCPVLVTQTPQKTPPFVVSAGNLILWWGVEFGESYILCSPSLPPENRFAYTAFIRMSPKGISVAVSGVMLFRIRYWKEISIRNGLILQRIYNITAIWKEIYNKNTTLVWVTPLKPPKDVSGFCYLSTMKTWDATEVYSVIFLIVCKI